MQMVTCDICEFADCVLFDSFSSLSTLQRSLLTQSVQINISHLRHHHSKMFWFCTHHLGGATWSLQAAEHGVAKLQQTVQALAARFEARFNEVEMGSDVKAGCGWEWVGVG